MPVETAVVLDALRRVAEVPDPEVDHADRPSAVLVLLADGDLGAEVLLTRRPWHMRTHRGEVSFPGGRREFGETYESAALREAEEEVGLDPRLVSVHRRLEPVRPLTSNNWIVPVVATVPSPLRLQGRQEEVDRVWWQPLHDLTLPGTYREEYWDIGHGDHPVAFFHLDDETVWGMTARIITTMLEVVHDVRRAPPPHRSGHSGRG